MHKIQRLILLALAKGERNFARICPSSISSNYCSYHLRALMRRQLVVKTADGYQLSAQGKQLVAHFSTTKRLPRRQPVLCTLIFAAHPQGSGQFLVVKRGKEPLRGLWAPPFGKVHWGESLPDAAARELQEKVGLNATLMQHGFLQLQLFDGEDDREAYLDYLFAVFSAELNHTSDLQDDAQWVTASEYQNYLHLPIYEALQTLLQTSTPYTLVQEKLPRPNTSEGER